MKLGELVKLLKDISDNYPDAYSADVQVAGWDDNAYDGQEVLGVRMNYDISIGEHSGVTNTVFIIKRQ